MFRKKKQQVEIVEPSVLGNSEHAQTAEAIKENIPGTESQEAEPGKRKKGKRKKRKGIGGCRFRRFIMVICWLVFVGAFAWSVYKNYTAIDRITVKEREVVEEKVHDTSGIRTFVEDFGVAYFTYFAAAPAQADQALLLQEYLADDLIRLLPSNTGAQDITVSQVQVWEIEAADEEQTYNVRFSVLKQMGETQIYGTYETTVYEDGKDHVIVSLPAVVSMPGKAAYKGTESQTEEVEQVDAGTRDQVTAFLNTFFGVYPTASTEELEYYVNPEQAAVGEIGRDLTFVSVDQVVLQQDGETVKASCAVTYLDNVTGLNEVSEYNLEIILQEDNKCYITAM